MNELEPRITMITLGVTDLPRATAFYEHLFGLKPKPGTAGVSFFKLRSAWLALYPREDLAQDAGVANSPTAFSGVALAHNVRSREGVDAALLHAVKAGARITQPARDTEWGGYAGYFTDLDGHPWEIAWNPKLDIDPT